MLTMKTMLGASWLVSSRLLGRLIDVVTLLVLARTLSPADFGLTALAMTLIAIVDTVLEVPLTQALTRLRSIDRVHLDTAFTLGLLRSLLLMSAVLLAAWPFSIIYQDKRLILLIIVLACGPLARGLYSPGMVTFVRKLSFRQSFITEFLGKTVGISSSILIAKLGGGYWAIAANSIASPMVATAVSYVIAPYQPRFSLARMPDFSRFLGWYSLAQLVTAINWQFDRILLGQFVTKADLGRYAMASDLATLPTQSLIGPAMQPVMAAFSTINDDHLRLRHAYLKASFFTLMLAMPICVGISLTSSMIIDVLLGPKWSDAAYYLQWLSLTIPLSAYFQALYSLALATDRPNAIFRLNVIELGFRIVLISLGLYLYALDGVIAARGLISIIMFAMCLACSRDLVGVSVMSQVANLWKIAAACAAMAVLVLLLRGSLSAINPNAVIRLASTASLGAAVYIGTLFALGVRVKAIAGMGVKI